MALTINIKPPLTVPTLVLERVPNAGTYTPGSYTFGIFLSGMFGGEGLICWNSPCIEQTIILQQNDGVKLKWSNLDVNAKRLYIFKKLTSSYTDLAWGNGYNYNAGYSLIDYPTEVTLTDVNAWDLRAGSMKMYEPNNYFFGLRPDKGIGRIEVISDVSFTIFDVIAAVKASTMIEGEDYIKMTSLR